MVLCAVLAALLFMSIGACSALGVARHFGGGFRGGYEMSAPRGMNGFGGRSQDGSDARSGRGFDQGRGSGRDQGTGPVQLPSQDASATY
jgi:hypothetical protein